MRLEKIKLAGFKSFVDPTSVAFPSNLVGVVGPNGCGKSNVIDAVRWVMGESSAKMLRGESMADVIFNGSTGRKPVGTASIELVFDNSDGRAGGEYARFAQISVKRQVTRDGQSTYFLNGARCRRRDIQDLFLGTGLGPRSYAIIEQGMISRIIEARPEDLRLFLEEAAGISKYKERRRETENRMRHTRENLERLDDLREEVGKQLEHLERQAATAEKYTRLKAEERQLGLELKALRWRALATEIATDDRHIAEAETGAEGHLAEQRRIESELEQRRAARAEAGESFNKVQERFYAVGAEIARTEQAIEFASQARARTESELARLDQEQGDAARHLERDRARLVELEQALAADEPELARAEQALAEVAGSVMTAEEQLRSWEAEWDRFNREAAQPAEQAQVERARINAIEQRIERDRERRRRIEEEVSRLRSADVHERIEVLEEQEEVCLARIDDFEQRQHTHAETLAEHDRALRTLAAELDQVRTELQQTKGRHASLLALQEASLAESAGGDWLAGRGLADAPRLLDGLEVEPGWERAVECVLGERLGALGCDHPERHLIAPAAVPSGVMLFDSAATSTAAVGETLAARVRGSGPLDALLVGVLAAEGVEQALADRARLAAGEYWVTREGFRVGRDWWRAPPTDDDGVLARAEAVRGLEQQIETLEAREQVLLEDDEQRRAARAEAEQVRAATAATLAEYQRELSTLRSELAGLRTRDEHQRARLQALAEERTELEEQRAEALLEMEDRRERLHDLLAEVDALAERRESLDGERERLRAVVAEGRERERGCREQAQTLRVRVESNRTAQTATRHSLDRAEERGAQLAERRETLLDSLEAGVEPLAEQRERLEEQLELRVEIEARLGEARARVETLEAEQRALEQARQRLEQLLAGAHQGLDALRLARQERLVRQRTLEEQLAESAASAPTLLEGLDPEATEEVWQQRLTQTGNRIQRLGAINLAAIDEFKEQSQRKTYLDAQHADISDSLETLEQAIRKIDRETRTRFKATYEQVNSGFQAIFPRLFGGGHAYLELTDDDLLETGVSVMARPPGKRNSSIHLLSGGEKALTAVALVFAIFELNPAPFCMLDEVDAPLDDANVGRFCELVRSMSDRVQFIFISHNKVTMEIADHLLGVTMHEPGVSRLVAVDVDEAVRLAAV
ncbi:chromosome segregation protein SMC [Marichromatium purpuratum 984]|uniref:Chromosome partition protein Smc n=1 Tax=Marichromatium purpuratum 984 TaxID=765910 RepID=W0DZX2_MARPU|nr:chromosome segregation protein SMC [Marichromatium purpuratum]AHF02813.1 chromosome segregation protein SMC [Marichromatium purpuratum 984]